MDEHSPEDTVQFLISTAMCPPSTWSRDAVWSRQLPSERFSGRLPACTPVEYEEFQRNWMLRALGCTGGKHGSLAQNPSISGPSFPLPGTGCSRPRVPSQAKRRHELFHRDPSHSYNTSSAPILCTSLTRFHQQLGLCGLEHSLTTLKSTKIPLWVWTTSTTMLCGSWLAAAQRLKLSHLPKAALTAGSSKNSKNLCSNQSTALHPH